MTHWCRAGRCQAGVCYHLFSRVRYNNLPEFQDPEILRHPLQVIYLPCNYAVLMFYTDLHDIILWSDTASDGH